MRFCSRSVLNLLKTALVISSALGLLFYAGENLLTFYIFKSVMNVFLGFFERI